MIESMMTYVSENTALYIGYIVEHILISMQALALAGIIGVMLGYVGYQYPRIRSWVTGLSQGLRVIPSLGILFILIPLIGVVKVPALLALVILGLPPVVLNTIVGLAQVSEGLMETGTGLGMTHRQLIYKVAFPLALPYILIGLKLALVEIISSATLATYIGAGGLGNIIFTGLGLYRYDLLILGGASVAMLSLVSMVVFDLIIRKAQS